MALDLARLGSNIRAQRTSRGWSLGDLADKTGLSKAYLSDLENGKGGRPNVQYLLQIGTHLEATVERLVNGEVVDSAEQLTEIGDRLWPSGLREFAAEDNLNQDEVIMLAQLHFRGRRPHDAQSWRAVFQVLKAVSRTTGDSE